MKEMAPYRAFGDWLKEKIQAGGFKSREFAKMVGCSHSSVVQWGEGRTKPSGQHLKGLARVLGVDVPYLENLLGDPALPAPAARELGLDDLLRLLPLKTPWFLPVSGIASAGPGGQADGIWRDPADKSWNLRLVEITGDCMEPEISAGDLVTVDLDGKWEEGAIVVANYDGGTVAKIYHGDYLQGHDGEPIPITQVQILGVADDVRKNLKRRAR